MPSAEAAAAGTAVSQSIVPVSFSWGGYLQAVGLMFFLVFVLWAVLWLLRRSGRIGLLQKNGKKDENLLRIESQIPLGPRRGLMVVRFCDKKVLLGLTPDRIVSLSETFVENGDDIGTFAGSETSGAEPSGKGASVAER